jgi:transposase InsO family protein
MANGIEDGRLKMALCRYQVISAYLAENPKRGRKRQLLHKLAGRIWTGPDGQPLAVAPDTLRVWVRRYRQGGLEALMDKARPSRGVGVLTAEQVDLICQLKREVPERSVDRVIRIAEQTGTIEKDTLKRSTVHRVLQRHDLSARRPAPERRDLDRFEADHPADLWQSDMLAGPWLPDPQRPTKMRRAYLFAFLDDHSRLLLHGRFSFKEDLPHLELVFRRAIQKWGVPKRLYYDNGAVYRADHMKVIVAALGIHRLIFTRAYRPMGHGKIEALNRLIRRAFIAELAASRIDTLDALNEAFNAWADLEYNRKVHSETGQTPLDRFQAGADRIAYAEEQALRQAFLWREQRTPDKTGVFSLFGTRYQVTPKLARRRIEVRFDPEALFEVEIWRNGIFCERAQPLCIEAHRRPKPAPAAATESCPQMGSADPKPPPTCDYLAHLVAEHRKRGTTEPDVRAHVEAAKHRRSAHNRAIVELLADRLLPDVVDIPTIEAYLDRFGPFDPIDAAAALDALIDGGGQRDQHVTVYLDAIKKESCR